MQEHQAALQFVRKLAGTTRPSKLLYRWRRLMNERGVAAVGSDEPVVGSSEVKKLEDKVRELERLLDLKTMENEILREAHSPSWNYGGRGTDQ